MSEAIDRFQRWRLILGPAAEESLRALRDAAGRGGVGEPLLTEELRVMDEALGALYDGPVVEEERGRGRGRRGAGLGAGRGRLARWLGDVRRYFDRDVVALLQRDALERRELTQLLLEPELLGQVTPSVELVATLLALKDRIPERTRETARRVVREVVDELARRMAPAFERAVRGALDRSRRAPVASLANVDWGRTIRASLGNYVPARRAVVPARIRFHARAKRAREWSVVVCLDQSASMAESVVYGAVMGSIFASLPALETHLVAFDAEVVDLTARYTDPVDLLFGVQLGGGTDIARAVRYAQGLVRDPRRTLFVLVSDLGEGGDARDLVRRMASLVAGGTRAVCLLSLSDAGVAAYDERVARQLRAVGVPCFGCTPRVLPEVLEAALRGRDLEALAARVGGVGGPG